MVLERERIVERRLSDVAANLPGMIFRRVEDANGTVHYPYVSAGRGGPASVALMTNAEAGGDGLAQLIHPDDRAAWGTAFAMLADAEPSHLEVRTVPDDALDGGSNGRNVRWLRVMARPSPQADTREGRTGTEWRST